MPKVLPSARRHRHQQHRHHEHHHQPHTLLSNSPQHSNILLAAPRKVSFEDGHQSSSSFGSATSLTRCPQQQDTSSIDTTTGIDAHNPSRSRLRRKAPSSCLSGLLEECASSEEPNSSSSSDDCLTPRRAAHSSAMTASVSAPSSPWGHFVDILVPHEGSGSHHAAAGDMGAPLFDSFSSSHNNDSQEALPTFRPKRQRHHHHSTTSSSGVSSSHPYGLLPRHARRRQLRQHQQQKSRPRSRSEGDSSMFLPGFFLEAPNAIPAAAVHHHRVPLEAAPTEVSVVVEEDTRSVETALQRLTVGTSD